MIPFFFFDFFDGAQKSGGSYYWDLKRYHNKVKRKKLEAIEADIEKAIEDPKEEKKKAYKVVSKPLDEAVKTVDKVDLVEFDRKLDMLYRLFNPYNKAPTNKLAENSIAVNRINVIANKKAIARKLLADMIENENVEFLLMH